MTKKLLEDAEVLYVTHDGQVQALEFSRYPSGEPLVDDPNIPVALIVRQQSLEAFITAMFWVDSIKARGGRAPTLILPNVPGARQDRMNPAGDVLFTIRSIAAMINAREFPQVVILDPHSDVTPALIERCGVMTAHNIIEKFLINGIEDPDRPRYCGVISPDAGAEKRAGAVAKVLSVPLIHAWKTRSVADGKISGFGIEELALGHYLVVDDLCDGGGTFIGLAALLGEVTADLYVTHGLFTNGTANLFKVYERIFCTDSTVGPKPGVTVLPVLAHSILPDSK